MSIFAWCIIIGCAVLALGIVFDGPLDEALPDGAIPVLAVAVAVFGAVGMGVQALVGDRPHAAIAWGLPVTLALAAGGATRWSWRRLRRSLPRNATPPSAEEVVGEEVQVLWWKSGEGEVRAVVRGHQLTLSAHSAEPLSAGERAWVVDCEDDGLLVTPWRHIDA
ncbi:nodulation protein NfeD [Actinomyces slackii]|uniref:NfeD-like C-terminal, partner-binding n=1 Tax=Actinomyces slackii TaxID=52774 RepID=A0A448K915_9ACTO|nr:nodulation protein NfeD [Actinomyces slackii]VEG73459.1 NfeD-like C-terminal, partner-binding [Actinomyces slackii]